MTTDQKETSILTDFSSNKPILAIFFSSMGYKGAISPFSFLSTSKKIDAKKLFIRDLNNLWYHTGLPEITRNIEEIAKYLSQHIRNTHTQRTIMIGNSMGGYAALLFGTLLSVNTVIAFSPKTFVSPVERFFVGDWNNWRQVWKLFWQPNAQRKYFDLKQLIKRKSSQTQYHIYFSSKNRIDRLHAFHIKNYQNIILHPYNFTTHGLVKHLKDNDELQRILKDHIHKHKAI